MLFSAQAASPPDPIEDALRLFATVYGIVEQNYADPIDPEHQLYKGAIPGMLRRLDPYSVFFDAEQFRILQQHQQSKSEGFGTIVTVMPTVSRDGDKRTLRIPLEAGYDGEVFELTGAP